MQLNCDIALLTPIVVGDRRRDLRFPESVRAVELFDGVNVSGEVALAVAAVAETNEAGGLDVHSFPQGPVVEIFIAFDLQLHQLVAACPVHDVLDHLDAVVLRELLEIGFYVEIALRLEILDQVAAAFHQETLVHRVFLVHRQQTAHFALRHLCSLNPDTHKRPGVYAQQGRDPVTGLVVFQSRQRDAGEQVIMLLVIRSETIDARLQALLGERLPGPEPPKLAPPRGTDHRGG